MIQLLDIHKIYGSLHANDGVSLRVREGSIHALLGENGAGKSTLMKILSGFLERTSGRILISGRDADLSSPVKALKAGIGMLYQEPMDFPQLTVLENMMIGRPAGFLSPKKDALRDLERLSSELGFSFNAQAPVHTLTLGERQQLEIIRLISLGVNVLILDEPTTGITDLQKSALFSSLSRLRDMGKSVILVSHKLEDVEALCDEATVLQSGRVSGYFEKPFDTNALLRCMFPEGDSIRDFSDREQGLPFFSLDRVSAFSGRVALKPLTLHVRRSEVIGLAGLEGSGQELFLRSAAGLTELKSGAITLDTLRLSGRPFRYFLSHGIFFVPGSRMEEGLISGLTVTEHVALNRSGGSLFFKMKSSLEKAEQAIRTFFIKAAPDSVVDSLSGGNQQRLLLSLLPERPRLLLLENPTRGLDHDSTQAVWDILLTRCRDYGTALIFSSSELDEIFKVADRILVFSNGELTMDRPCRDVSRNDVGLAVAGIRKPS